MTEPLWCLCDPTTHASVPCHVACGSNGVLELGHPPSTMLRKYPYLTEMAMAVSHDGGLGGCDDDVEFEFALDLVLDGLERLRDTASPMT